MVICPHDKLGHDLEVVIVGLGTEKLCDACRRRLCTCERCSAFAGEKETILTHAVFCCAAPVVQERFIGAWCRDGWRQARPWTREEVDRWLGNEGESTAAQTAAEAPGGWQEKGP